MYVCTYVICFIAFFFYITAITTTLHPHVDSSEEDNVTMSLSNVIVKPEFSWHYVRCPPENECINGHHTCSHTSEKCFDLEDGFECKCGDGYRTDV